MKAEKMKAIVVTKYGSPEVLQIQNVDKPSIKEDEILIKVHATPVTKADTMMRKADPYISRFFLGFSRPKRPIIGTGFAGTIENVGEAVKEFKIGDSVFGETGVNFSANAEYIAMPANGVLAIKPENMSFEEAATICDGPMTSLNFLREIGQIKQGQKVLINGASGSLGTAAVQLAKYFGAEVTGVSSTRNLELVKSLGADKVIDYTKEDFTKTGETYDIIYDTIGKSSFFKSKKALNPKGVYLSPVLKLSVLIPMIWTSMMGGKKAKFSATGLLPTPELLKLLKKLRQIIEGGYLKTILDKSYPLDQSVEAHRYVDTGRKKGNVVLVV